MGSSVVGCRLAYRLCAIPLSLTRDSQPLCAWPAPRAPAVSGRRTGPSAETRESECVPARVRVHSVIGDNRAERTIDDHRIHANHVRAVKRAARLTGRCAAGHAIGPPGDTVYMSRPGQARQAALYTALHTARQAALHTARSASFDARARSLVSCVVETAHTFCRIESSFTPSADSGGSPRSHLLQIRWVASFTPSADSVGRLVSSARSFG